jgi:hypothetical protein
MKRYEVTIIRTAYATIEVDAENQEQAEAKAWDQYQNDADDCVGNDIWNVEEMEEENNDD